MSLHAYSSFFIFAKVVFASKREGKQYLYNCGLGAENRALCALAKVQLPEVQIIPFYVLCSLLEAGPLDQNRTSE